MGAIEAKDRDGWRGALWMTPSLLRQVRQKLFLVQRGRIGSRKNLTVRAQSAGADVVEWLHIFAALHMLEMLVLKTSPFVRHVRAEC